jgi:transposase
MAIPVATPKALLADKGYDGDRFRESLLLRGIRRIATRYDKTALSFASFLNLASIRLWLKSFVNRT